MILQLKNWLRRDDGIAGIEFGLLGLPFITLLLAILEFSFYFASGVVLEGATAHAARMIRTGQIHYEREFQSNLCDKIGLLMTCRELQYEVYPVKNNLFAYAQPAEINEDGKIVPGDEFSTGVQNDVILVRTAYQYNFMIPFLDRMTAESSRVEHRGLIISTAVVRNEPYGDTEGTCCITF